jgi:signal transduction histidine kinase
MANTLKDREAGVRAYTDHVTHELKSPLTSLIGASELLDADTPGEDRARLIETIRAASRKMQEQLDALRRLATARDPVGPGPARLSHAAGAVEAAIPFDLNGDAEVPIDANALAAILTHLAQNAAAHGATRLSLEPIHSGFSVSDDGRGIATGNRARIFDPFFTTRREHGGTGMGLTIVRTMLQAAGGHIALAPSRNGARFDITFTD